LTAILDLLKSFEANLSSAFYDHFCVVIPKWSTHVTHERKRKRAGITDEGVTEEVNKLLNELLEFSETKIIKVYFTDTDEIVED